MDVIASLLLQKREQKSAAGRERVVGSHIKNNHCRPMTAATRHLPAQHNACYPAIDTTQTNGGYNAVVAAALEYPQRKHHKDATIAATQ